MKNKTETLSGWFKIENNNLFKTTATSNATITLSN